MSEVAILLVEDNAVDAELLEAALSTAGIQFSLTRVDTREAFENALESRAFDIILSDHSLPAFDGRTALAIANERRLDIPFIFVSGTIGEELAVETLKGGATDYVLKNRLSRLAPALQRALAEKEERGKRRAAETALSDLLSRLETERALFQAVLRQMPGGVTVAEARSGRIILDNDQSRRILGHDEISDAETAASAANRAFHLDGSPYLPHEWPLNRSVTSGVYVQGEEVDYVRKDGTRVRVLINSAPVRDKSGRIIAAVATFYDVTEQRHVEQLFLQSQKMEAVGRLAGGVAHDFNNLLTVILGYCSLLLDEPVNLGGMREPLETIKSCGERAAALTHQLLAFSRKQVRQVRILSLNDVVVNTQKVLPRLLGEDIEVNYRLDPRLWPVNVDPTQLDQVILNLAVNARDAMPRGGVLTIETANVVLDDNYCRVRREVSPGDYVVLAVSDNGVGMDQITMSHIFEPFFTSKETGKGTGLGLATVLGIVKQSGGSIWVYSEVGRGTTFKIYLPRTIQHAQEAPQTAMIDDYFNGTETILLVEDSAMIRALAIEILSRHGYTVIEACDIDEALNKSDAYSGEIDLVLTDIVMPKASGREVVEAILGRRPSIKYVYMSGYTNEALSHHMDIGPDLRFLEKPFTQSDLLRLIRQTLQTKA